MSSDLPEQQQLMLSGLQSMHGELRNRMRDEWQRCLPFPELLVDRWEKARYLGFGEGASIYDSSCVIGDVRVGAGTWIGPFTMLDGSGGLTIGAQCSISTGVQIYTHDSVQWALSRGQKAVERAPTVIGSGCYIGPNSIVAKGVSIGDGCVIGAMSLVLDDIPPNSKAVGCPARVIGPAIPEHDAEV